MPASVDLRVRDEKGVYAAKSTYVVPADHAIGDKLFPYEGIGWENAFVGYRLYLDGRTVTDVFGKTPQQASALGTIDADTDYHVLQPWGMDLLKVGGSLGVGGLGVMRDGAPTHIGPAKKMRVTVDADAAPAARFVLSIEGFDDGVEDTIASVSTQYSLAPDHPMTMVRVENAVSGLPFATGIVHHDGVEIFRSPDQMSGNWRYVATFGQQSEIQDRLGLALFYQMSEAIYGGVRNDTHFITFNDTSFEYAFAAVWENDAGGVTNRTAFETFLNDSLTRLNKSAAGPHKTTR